MRADMTPEEVRAAGIYLNGGRRRGWKRRLSALLDTPEATITGWSTRSRGNARPISGAAAVAIGLLVAMMRQELMLTAHPGQAGDALVERVMALLRRPDPLAHTERPITIEGSLPAVMPPLPGQPPPAPQHMAIQSPPTPVSLPFGAKPKPTRGGQPGSSA